jgi:hypothetical protein
VIRQLFGFAFTAAFTAIIAGSAQASTVQAAVGNTIISTYPDGRTAELWLQADGAYTGKGRKGDQLGGRWTIKADKLCMRQSRPFAIFFSFCAVIPDVGLNVAWPSRAPTGEAITIRVVPGKVGS